MKVTDQRMLAGRKAVDESRRGEPGARRFLERRERRKAEIIQPMPGARLTLASALIAKREGPQT